MISLQGLKFIATSTMLSTRIPPKKIRKGGGILCSLFGMLLRGGSLQAVDSCRAVGSDGYFLSGVCCFVAWLCWPRLAYSCNSISTYFGLEYGGMGGRCWNVCSLGARIPYQFVFLHLKNKVGWTISLCGSWISLVGCLYLLPHKTNCWGIHCLSTLPHTVLLNCWIRFHRTIKMIGVYWSYLEVLWWLTVGGLILSEHREVWSQACGMASTFRCEDRMLHQGSQLPKGCVQQ